MGLLDTIKDYGNKRRVSGLLDLDMKTDIRSNTKPDEINRGLLDTDITKPNLNSETILFNAISKPKIGLEGWSSTPYRDGGFWSIGYGRRSYEGEPETTKAVEKDWLRGRISEEIDFIRDNVNVDLSPNQEASLASLSYNIGRNAFKNSEALKFLNKGDIKSFAFEAFDPQKGFVKMGDKIIPGLQNRREKERLMFFNEN